jgi:hypothetical protein
MSGSGQFPTAQIQNFEFELKIKNPKKNTLSCSESNGLIFENIDTIRFYTPQNIFRNFSFIFQIFNSDLKSHQILH